MQVQDESDFFAKPAPKVIAKSKAAVVEKPDIDSDDSAFFERPAPAAPLPWTPVRQSARPKARKPVELETIPGPRERGKVLFFRHSFGFIVPDAGGREVFFHQSGISMDGYRTLAEGDLVSYQPAKSVKGPAAIDIVREAL